MRCVMTRDPLVKKPQLKGWRKRWEEQGPGVGPQVCDPRVMGSKWALDWRRGCEFSVQQFPAGFVELSVEVLGTHQRRVGLAQNSTRLGRARRRVECHQRAEPRQASREVPPDPSRLEERIRALRKELGDTWRSATDLRWPTWEQGPTSSYIFIWGCIKTCIDLISYRW